MSVLWAGLLVVAAGPAATGLASGALAEPPELPSEVVATLERRISSHLMMPGKCQPTELPGWEGVALSSCDYEAGGIRASVILANASPARMARWMVRSCMDLAAPDVAGCAEKLRKQVRRASDYQFPVAGIILEDIDPDEPGYEVYAFRNGVTVRVEGVENGKHFQPTAEQIERAKSGEVQEAMVFARIASTTREHYRKAGGRADVGTSAASKRKVEWVSVVGELWREAHASDHNALLHAWALAYRRRLTGVSGDSMLVVGETEEILDPG